MAWRAWIRQFHDRPSGSGLAICWKPAATAKGACPLKLAHHRATPELRRIEGMMRPCKQEAQSVADAGHCL